MAKRFSLVRDRDGTFSIIDAIDGRIAVYAGRDLTRIPADLADHALELSNALEHAERREATSASGYATLH